MATYIQPGGGGNRGVTLEDVAEEVLNGLFCHYEPPVSDQALQKAAKFAKEHPQEASRSGRLPVKRKSNSNNSKFSMTTKKNKSILKPYNNNNNNDASSATKKKEPTQSKNVTWRDEKAKDQQEETIAANPCDFFGLSTRNTTNNENALTDVHLPNSSPKYHPSPLVRRQQTPMAAGAAVAAAGVGVAAATSSRHNQEEEEDAIEKFREKKSPTSSSGSSGFFNGFSYGLLGSPFHQQTKFEPPEHTLYDDEGNPMTNNNNNNDYDYESIQSLGDETEDTENVPPGSRRRRSGAKGEEEEVPILEDMCYSNPFCGGLDSVCFSESRKIPRETEEQQVSTSYNKTKMRVSLEGNDDDVYEPDTYKPAPTKQNMEYRRVRSPPVRRSHRYDYGNDQDGYESAEDYHGRSPDGRGQKNWNKPSRRPATPYRRGRGDEDDISSFETDNSLVVDQDAPSRRRSASQSRSPGRRSMSTDRHQHEYSDDEEYNYRRYSRSPGGRYPSRSPSQQRDPRRTSTGSARARYPQDQDYDERDDRHRPTLARRTPPALKLEPDENDAGLPERNRDPTPRSSAGHGGQGSGPLPPTPRRDEQSPDRRASNGRSARRSLSRALSPVSLATEDEIREEVSSVGVEESSFTRKEQYPNPFLAAEKAENKTKTIDSKKKVKVHPQMNRQSQPGGASSDSSKKSNRMFKGFSKRIGRVKAIVREIDAKRLPVPGMLGKAPQSTGKKSSE